MLGHDLLASVSTPGAASAHPVLAVWPSESSRASDSTSFEPE
jgi:hypothetical protein